MECIVNKSFEGKNGVLKSARLIENSKRIFTDDPNEFAKIVFGEKFTSANLMTFEQCLDVINSQDFKFSKRRKEVISKIKQELINLQLEIPENLKKLQK